MKILITCILSFVAFFHAEELPDTIGITSKLDSMRSIQFSQPVDALKLGLQIMEKIPRQPANQTIAKTLTTLGDILYSQGIFGQALEYYNKALDDYLLLGDSIAVGWLYINIGNMYFHQNLFDQSEEKYQRAFRVFKNSNLQTGMATTLNNLALIALEKSDLNKAMDYFQRGLNARIILDDPALLAHSYLYIGDIYLQRDSIQQALDFFNKALEIGISTDTLNLTGRSYQYLGETNLLLGEEAAALENFHKAKSDYMEHTNVVYLVGLYQSMADLYNIKGQNDSALVYLNHALLIATKNDLNDSQIEILEKIIRIQKKQGKFNKLSHSYEQKDSLLKTLYGKEKKHALLLSEIQQELSASKRTLSESEALLERTVLMRNAALVIGIFMALLLWLLYRRYTYKKEIDALLLRHQDKIYRQKLSVEQLKSLQYQLKPHFLYNILNSLHVLIRRSPERARKMTLHLAGYFQYILSSDEKECVPLENEIKMIKEYFELQKIRYDDELTSTVFCPKDLYNQQVPAMILYPLVENAVKYGYRTHKGRLNVNFTVQKKAGMLHFTIENDGCWVKPSRNTGSKEQRALREYQGGIGLDNIRKRLRRIYSDNWSLKHEEKNGKVFVHLRIPIK